MTKIISHRISPPAYQTENWTLEINGTQYVYIHRRAPVLLTSLTLLEEFAYFERPSEQILYGTLLPMDTDNPDRTLKQFHKLLMLQ